eukprot:gene15173-6368_t
MGEHAAVIYGTHFPNRLFVGCLPESATALELGNHFSQFGKVAEAKILKDDCGRSKRFGFVSFQNEESVKRVLNERPIRFKGKLINVGPAVKKDGTDTPRSVSPNIDVAAAQDLVPEASPSGLTHVPLPQNRMACYKTPQITQGQLASVPMMTSSQITIPTTTYFAATPTASTHLVQHPLPMNMFPMHYQPVANATSTPAAIQGAYFDKQQSQQCFIQNSPPLNHQLYLQHHYGEHRINNARQQELHLAANRQFHEMTKYNPCQSTTYFPMMNCVF